LIVDVLPILNIVHIFLPHKQHRFYNNICTNE